MKDINILVNLSKKEFIKILSKNDYDYLIREFAEMRFAYNTYIDVIEDFYTGNKEGEFLTPAEWIEVYKREKEGERKNNIMLTRKELKKIISLKGVNKVIFETVENYIKDCVNLEEVVITLDRISDDDNTFKTIPEDKIKEMARYRNDIFRILWLHFNEEEVIDMDTNFKLYTVWMLIVANWCCQIEEYI